MKLQKIAIAGLSALAATTLAVAPATAEVKEADGTWSSEVLQQEKSQEVNEDGWRTKDSDGTLKPLPVTPTSVDDQVFYLSDVKQRLIVKDEKGGYSSIRATCSGKYGQVATYSDGQKALVESKVRSDYPDYELWNPLTEVLGVQPDFKKTDWTWVKMDYAEVKSKVAALHDKLQKCSADLTTSVSAGLDFEAGKTGSETSSAPGKGTDDNEGSTEADEDTPVWGEQTGSSGYTVTQGN